MLATADEKLGTSTRITIGPRLEGGGSEIVGPPSAGGNMPSSPAANGSMGGATEVCSVVRSYSGTTLGVRGNPPSPSTDICSRPSGFKCSPSVSMLA